MLTQGAPAFHIVFIAFGGLFGLISFVAAQRKREMRFDGLIVY